MMGPISQGAGPGAADALLNLLDMIANPDQARALATDLRTATVQFNAATQAAAVAQTAAEAASAKAASDIEKAQKAAVAGSKLQEEARAMKAENEAATARSKAEIQAGWLQLNQAKEDADNDAQAAQSAAAVVTAAQDQRTKALDAREKDIEKSGNALDARETALTEGEATYATKVAALKALAG